MPGFLRRRGVLIALQLVALAVIFGFLGYALRDAWADAGPRLRDASLLDLAIALTLLAAYYLLFVVGWMWILAALAIRVPYRVALQAEMLSMLAKYVPGGVWTPAARVVAMRRFGVKETAPVLGSILLEAGLSAISGVLVLVAGLVAVDEVDAPWLPLAIFTIAVAIALHPRIFRPAARLLLRPFGASDLPPLRYPVLLGLLVFYAVTWLVGGAALLYLLRSVGGDVAASAIPFLGGTAAVGAIVAVLSVIAPSGLGVREASMYGLLLAVTTGGIALGATVLNRIAITVVEAALLGAGALAALRRRHAFPPAVPGTDRP